MHFKWEILPIDDHNQGISSPKLGHFFLIFEKRRGDLTPFTPLKARKVCAFVKLHRIIRHIVFNTEKVEKGNKIWKRKQSDKIIKLKFITKVITKFLFFANEILKSVQNKFVLTPTIELFEGNERFEISLFN